MSNIVHGGDCDGTWCDYCGCCEHGEAQDGIGCRAADAPQGMRCPGNYCGCEGAYAHQKPVQPEPAPEPDEAPHEVQLHQETALDFGGWAAS